MKKYFLKKTNEEIKFGDIIEINEEYPFGSIYFKTIFTKETLEYGKDLFGIIEKEVPEDKDTDKEKDYKNTTFRQFSEPSDNKDNKSPKKEVEEIRYVLKYIGNMLHTDTEGAIKFCEKLKLLNPLSLMSLYLKILSKKFNRKYEFPVKNQSFVYGISTINGEINSIPVGKMLSVKHLIYYFRSIEDAQYAKRCIAGLLEEIYGKNK